MSSSLTPSMLTRVLLLPATTGRRLEAVDEIEEEIGDGEDDNFDCNNSDPSFTGYSEI